jgi:predicted nucleic acid-binding protein
VSYLIDSDVLISVMQGEEAAGLLVAELSPQGVSISAITYMEVLQGLLDQPVHARSEFHRFLRDVPLLSVDRYVAHRCAVLRDALSREGKRVRQRALDLMIAATAIKHDLTLVTRNRHDYHDISGLILFERS